VIVCLCRNLSDAAIRAQLDAGARTAEDVARATGAGTDCGCCREAVEDLVRASGPCSVPPCAGCPRAASALRRDAA
jgi:bacterioferritin-associated ferredoxin